MARAFEVPAGPQLSTHFGGEDWSAEWPDEAEAGCLAACFSDASPTDSCATIHGLGHAYLSVVANEGILLFVFLILFGVSLGALSVWLSIRLVQTHEFLFIAPLVPTSLLTAYCWGYLGLKYRFRRLFFEIIFWPFIRLSHCGAFVSRTITRARDSNFSSRVRRRRGSAIQAHGSDTVNPAHNRQPSHMGDKLPTPSDLSFDWPIAKQWILSCQDHPLCQNEFLNNEQRVFLPRRLLEITPGSSVDDCSSEKAQLAVQPCIRMVETAHIEWLDHEPSYVALSHFFGDTAEESKVSHLTADNLEKLKTYIPFDTLPMLFQNAIVITNQLGFRYLWIDRLCVMEGSEEDQVAQLAQRGLVFSNSVCTISISSPTARPGICLTTEPTIPGAEVNKDSRKSKSGGPGSAIAAMDHMFVSHVDSQALNRWSWTYFQDRLLSRRILHICGDSVVLFECNMMRASNNPLYRQGVPYSSTLTASCSSLARAPQTSKALVPGSKGPNCPGKTYNYLTRKKMVDQKSGAFKFETVVVTKEHGPDIQEQLEALQSSLAWRRHRGVFQRLLRPTQDLNSYVGDRNTPKILTSLTKIQMEERLGLHNAWFALVCAYSSSSSLINKGSQDRNRNRLLGLSGVVDVISHIHRQDNFQLILGPNVAGLWLETMPFNLLWYRSNPAIVAAPKQTDPGYFTQYPGAVLHYQAPAGSLDSRDRFPSHNKIPTWSWASIDGQVSHNLPPRLARNSGHNADGAKLAQSLKKLFTSSKSQHTEVETQIWNLATPLIDRAEVYDHWTHIIQDMPNNDGGAIVPSELSQLRLRVRNLYPVLTLPPPQYGPKGIHVFYDSIDRLHQAVYPGHDMAVEPTREEGKRGGSPITRAVFGLPILELSNWGNDPLGIDSSKWKRQVHGLALRHVSTVDGRGDVYERVGYFYTTDQEAVSKVLQSRGWGNIVWIQ